ncbi:hypothetical protein [Ferrimonas pelagia]|uniref:Uncharacterized protein n=1 Tax=Ferrimonas pelagia TaxID=1177826 RepID=A0ABP9E7V6_9GAMM
MHRDATLVSDSGIMEGEWWLADSAVCVRTRANRRFDSIELKICLRSLSEVQRHDPAVPVQELPAEQDLYRFRFATQPHWTLECHASPVLSADAPLTVEMA